MAALPEKTEQIRQAHAGLIHRVVIACQNPGQVPDLETILKQAEDNGWLDLAHAIRQILKGRRDAALLKPLDEEDRVIADSILRGLQDPNTLPDLNAQPDPAQAAPALAAMIHAVGRGDIAALQMLAAMAQQMLQSGGDMARLSGVMNPLVKGEREPEKLTKGMGPQGEKLVLDILAELKRLETH
ncbi:MAG TPA: hypothetical protein VGA00_10920 [Acidiferrobacterales bacterium]